MNICNLNTAVIVVFSEAAEMFLLPKKVYQIGRAVAKFGAGVIETFGCSTSRITGEGLLAAMTYTLSFNSPYEK